MARALNLKDRVAELMSLDLEPRLIAERLQISRTYVYKLIQLIKADLGWLGD